MSTTLTYDSCDQCSSPLDEQQRYCVVCGAARRLPDDPVARFLAAASARRAQPPQVVALPVASRGDGRWLAVALALLPVAAAIGVLAGRGGGTDDDKLLAALRAQAARPAAASGTGAKAASAAAVALPSDLTLKRGWAVELKTLPWETTTKADAAKAEAGAKAKGAKGVGIINPDDFRLTPSSGGDYVLYASASGGRAAARRTLAKLRKAFPQAKLVRFGPLVSAGKDAGAASAAPGAKKTSSAAEDLQTRATRQQKQQGAKIVQQIQATKGKSYVEQQRKLPDTIVVP